MRNELRNATRTEILGPLTRAFEEQTVPVTPHREVWLAQTEATAGTGGPFLFGDADATLTEILGH